VTNIVVTMSADGASALSEAYVTGAGRRDGDDPSGAEASAAQLPDLRRVV